MIWSILPEEPPKQYDYHDHIDDHHVKKEASKPNLMNDPLHFTLKRMWERRNDFVKVLDSHIEILIYEVGE